MSASRVFLAVFVGSIVCSPALMAQTGATTAAVTVPVPESLTGKWKAGGSSKSGTFYVILDLAQAGDSLSGIGTSERDGVPTDLQVELIGTIRDGKIDLESRDGSLRISGTQRRDIIRARITPGRYKNVLAISETTFTRLR